MAENGIERRTDEVSALRAALEALEARVRVLEGTLVLQREAPVLETTAAAARADGQRSRRALGRLAVVCFVLAGALVLRTVTRQGWLSPEIGAGIGLTYCALLLLGPLLLERVGRVLAHAAALELSGALLAPLIVLETVHRSGAMGLRAATAALAGVALLVALRAAMRRADGQVVVASVALIAADVGLGLVPEAVAARGGLVVGIAVIALVFAGRGGHAGLRPLVLLPAGLALAAAVALTARRPGIPPSVPLTLLLCALGVWGAVGVNTVLRARRLEGFERWAFPASTLLVYGLGVLYRPGLAHLAAAGLGAALLLLLAWDPGKGVRSSRAASGLLGLGGLLPLLGLPALEPRGLALAAFALALQRVGLAVHRGLGRVLSSALVLAATVVAVKQGSTLVDAHGPAGPLLLGAVTTALIALHFVEGIREDASSRVGEVFAVLSLACAAVLVFSLARLVVLRHLGPSPAAELAQTVVSALLASTALVFGRWRRLRGVVSLGLLGIVVVAAKVVVWDIPRLEGGYAVGSVLVLGVAALGTSIALRGRMDGGDR